MTIIQTEGTVSPPRLFSLLAPLISPSLLPTRRLFLLPLFPLSSYISMSHKQRRGCEQSVFHLHLKLNLPFTAPPKDLLWPPRRTYTRPVDLIALSSCRIINLTCLLCIMLGVTGEAVVLHGPFILLQSLPSPISIQQASADDSYLSAATGKQDSRRDVFLLHV